MPPRLEAVCRRLGPHHRYVLQKSVRVGTAEQVLPVQVRLGLDLRLVDAQQSARRGAQEPLEPALPGDRAVDLAALGRGQRVDADDDLFELAADDLVTFAWAGLKQSANRSSVPTVTTRQPQPTRP